MKLATYKMPSHQSWSEAAECRVREIERAGAQGLLTYERCAESLSKINAWHFSVSSELQATANDPSNFALKNGRTFGALRAVNQYSALARSFVRLDSAMSRIQILMQKYKVKP